MCVNCPDCNTVNDGHVKITGEHVANWIKLHPCDLIALTTGGGVTPVNVTSVDTVETTDFTIPAGFIHASIAIEAGTATINGAARPTGYMISLPPMQAGLRYPAYPVTLVSVGAIIHVNYHF